MRQGVNRKSLMRSGWFNMSLWSVMFFSVFFVGGFTPNVLAQSDVSSIILENFDDPDENGFPKKWDAQRSIATAKETYAIAKDGDETFLEARNASQRIYTKKISWDPRTHPILTWRWRVRAVPEGAEFIAAVYPSLDTDLMFIPVNTKYIWSLDAPVGTIKEGGMFGSTEMVIRSGAEPTGEWVEEKINVYEDFKNIHQHEPAPKAWGISLLGGPGVDIDFGSIAIHSK